MKINKNNSTIAAAPIAAPIAPAAGLLGKLRGISKPAPAAPIIAPSSPVGGLLGKLRGINKPAPIAAPIAPAAAPIVKPAAPAINTGAILERIERHQGKISESIDLTLEKFAHVEAMAREISELKSLFAAYAGAFEKITGEQNALLINSAGDIKKALAELNTIRQIRGEIKAPAAAPIAAPAAPIINRKAPAAAPIAPSNAAAPIADSAGLFAAFSANFTGQFCGATNDAEKIAAFEKLIEALPETNDAGAIDKAIRQEWTRARQAKEGQYCAAKSLAAMVAALLKTLTDCGMIAAAPIAAAPIEKPAPARIINAEILGKAFEFSAQELREMIQEIKDGGNALAIRNMLSAYGIENGIETITDQTINDLFTFAKR